MNLILLEEGDFVAPDRARLAGRRLAHVRDIHRAGPGDSLRVGRLGGALGTGRVLSMDAESLEIEVALDTPPPLPSPVTLAVALPRPPSLRKVLQQATALGVKHILLVHTRRVEKSYWQSRALEPAAIHEQLLLGLEQGRDTILPRIELCRRFRPFAEDRLPELLAGSVGLLADPEATQPAPADVAGPLTAIVGPEGGLLPFEVERLVAAGAEPVCLSRRILRVETAVVALLARLAP